MLRIFVFIFGFIFPWFIRRVYLNCFLGFKISRGARIGFSLVVPKALEMAEGARIGHLTIIKGIDLLKMGSSAALGNLNWVSGYPSDNPKHFSQVHKRIPSLLIGEHSAITNRHLIDCTDKVEIGRFSTFAGFRSQILTHSIDLKVSCQSCRPVLIGDYCFIGSASLILGGSSLPSYSVLGAGALLNSKHEEIFSLYGGVPSKKLMSLSESDAYFSRERGFVI